PAQSCDGAVELPGADVCESKSNPATGSGIEADERFELPEPQFQLAHAAVQIGQLFAGMHHRGRKAHRGLKRPKRGVALLYVAIAKSKKVVGLGESVVDRHSVLQRLDSALRPSRRIV